MSNPPRKANVDLTSHSNVGLHIVAYIADWLLHTKTCISRVIFYSYG